MEENLRLTMQRSKFCYDREAEPEAEIRSGQTVIFETEDANCGLIAKPEDRWQTFEAIYEAAGGCNPVTGPVYVRGAKPGDCLAVEILEVRAGGVRSGGYTSIQSGIGCLEDVFGTLQKPLASATRICEFENNAVHMKSEDGKRIYSIPMRPMVGSIGVAPKYDRRASLYQGPEWMGNVDLPELVQGTTVVLPVNVEGGLLWMGDVHACQGDGEITGCALECQGEIRARVTVLSKEEAGYVECPQINSSAWIGSVGMPFCSDLTAALRMGYTDLVRRLSRYYGVSEKDAYMLLGLCGRAVVGNEFTCLCRIDRSIFEK